MAFCERGCVRRILRPQIDCPCMTTIDMSNKAGSRLHYTRRSYGYEHRAGVQCTIDSIQMEWHFAEPANVWTNPTAALTPGYLGWRLVEVRVVKGRAAASVATTLEKLSVHVADAFR